jgi:large subunit ribosomal protein L25
MSQDTITVQVQSRQIVGKAVKHLRKAGLVPAVIHDHGKPSIIVAGEYAPLLKTYRQAGRHHPVELVADGKTYTTIIRTATFEPKKNRLTHLVFNAVSRNEKVETEVPVKPRYDEGNEQSPAERAGLLVLTHTDAVEIEAIPAKLPDALFYDAEKLVAIGDSVSVADLIVPAGVTVSLSL